MKILSFTQERGPMPALPDPSDVALEASVTLARAQAVIAASWHMAEAWTGRWWWPVTGAELVVNLSEGGAVFWPRWPYPAGVLAFDPMVCLAPMPQDGFRYFNDIGRVELPLAGRFIIRQVGTVTPPAPGPHVVEAVRCLALYQLIHSAARREFRSMQAGDSTLTRESTGPAMAASGAGALLAGEVRW